MKPTFIFGCGICWSGTTSLYKTLQFTQAYMHGGFFKESAYLNYIKKLKPHKLNPHATTYDLLFESLEIINRPDQNYIDDVDYKKNSENFLFYIKVLKKFSERELNYFFTNISVNKYIEYYVKLFEYCENERSAVADFSNQTIALLSRKPDYLMSVIEKLKTEFDVKCLIILRDPIRRKFSRDNVLTDINIKNYNVTNCIDYVKIIKKSYELFGKENTCYLIMEDFFSDNNQNEVSKLEKFLDTKIKSTYPCCFVPDRGINAPKIPGLRDQWSSDREILTKDLYLRLRNNFALYYDEFEQLHGFLPADWGRPIDYGY